MAQLRIDDVKLESEPEQSAGAADCVVIVTDHSTFDYRALVERSTLIVDTRNALKGLPLAKIVRL